MLFALLQTPIAPTAASASAPEQAIEEMAPDAEQKVQRLGTGDGEQQVRTLDTGDAQTVGPQEPPNPTAKTAKTAAKFFVGVTAAGIAIASGIASLLLL